MKYVLYIIICIIALCTTGCSDAFQGKVSPSNLPRGSLNDFSSNPNAPIALTAPQQLFVSAAEDIAAITVSWSKVAGADFYYVYRAIAPIVNDSSIEPKEEDYSLAKTVFGTITRDTVVEDILSLNFQSPEYNQHYYYKVAAYNNEISQEGPLSTASKGYLLAPPNSVTASTGVSYDSIALKWTDVKGAVRYEIFRTLSSDGSGIDTNNPLTVTVSTRYTNNIAKENQGKEYYYYVRAVNANGAASKLSPQAMGFSLQEGAPPIVRNVVAQKAESNESVQITWEQVSNAKYYIVYRNSSLSSQLEKIVDKVSGTSHKDQKGLHANVKYKYYIQAVSENVTKTEEVKGPFSSDISTTNEIFESNSNEIGYILSCPQNIIVVATTEGNKITFDPPINEKLSYTYKIEYSTEKSTWENTNLTALKDAGTSTYTAYHRDKAKGFYKISTIDGSNTSKPSEVIESAPLPITDFAITKLTENANGNGVFPLQLSWDAIEGAAKYDVYRSTSQNSGYKKLNTSTISGLTFFDTSDTVSGIYYYYKVLSLNGSETGMFSKDSAIKADYGYLNPRALYKEMEKTILSSQKKLTLMHKPASLDKLGSESVSGKFGGGLSYSANVSGLGARIIMTYSNYCDFKNTYSSPITVLNGNTNTSANMSSNGTMDGTVTISGMYNGTVDYNNIEIKGGVAGGGHYTVKVQAGNIELTGTVTYKGE